MKNIKPHEVADGALRVEGPVKPQIVAFLRRSGEQLEGWDTTQIARAFDTTFTYVAQCASEENLELPKIRGNADAFSTPYDNVSFSTSTRGIPPYFGPNTERVRLFHINLASRIRRIVRVPLRLIAA